MTVKQQSRTDMSIENAEDESSINEESSIPSIDQSEASTSKTDLETDKYGFIGGKEYTISRQIF